MGFWKKKPRRKRLRQAILGLNSLALLYVAAYIILLDPTAIEQLSHPPITSRDADYRIGGEFAKSLFTPLYWLDRLLRPDYWDYCHPIPPRPAEDEEEPDTFRF